VVQIASVTGIYGVSFAVAAVNAGIAEGILALLRGGARRRTAGAALALAALPALAVVLFGAVSLQRAPAPDAADDSATGIAIVQGNLPMGSRWRAEYYGRNLDTYLRSTLAVAGESGAEVVFWPESAMSFFLADEPLYRRAIGRVLAAADVTLVAGGPYAVPDSRNAYYNSVFAIGTDGEIAERYDKEYLVPFSEYFPFASVEFLRRRFEQVRTFSHGARTAPLDTRAGRAGILTCNESMLPEVAARRVADGATLLVNPSNDTWLDDDQFSELLFAITSVRAIEQRRYLVRASTSGPSGIIDPWGRVLRKSERAVRATVTGRVAERSERTVYARIGDGFALACVALSALAWVRSRRR